MNQQISIENPSQQNAFWGSATKYTALVTNDETFVNEIAYMMVTLHRTGGLKIQTFILLFYEFLMNILLYL